MFDKNDASNEEKKVSQRRRSRVAEAENSKREEYDAWIFLGRSLGLHSAADRVTPSRIRSVRPCSHRSSAKWKAARAKRVDDERVRKCASHVGELVQSHPSSASALLTRVWSRKRAAGQESRGKRSDSGWSEEAARASEEQGGGGEGEEEGEEEEETKGAEGRKEEKKGRAEVGRKLRCSVSRVPDSSARRFGEPVVGEPSVHDTRSHLRPTGASRVRLHAHATARLLKVLLTSEIYTRISARFCRHSFISRFPFHVYLCSCCWDKNRNVNRKMSDSISRCIGEDYAQFWFEVTRFVDNKFSENQLT